MTTRAHVAVLTRAPVPGEAKTRLAKGVGDVRAAELAAAFAADVVRTVLEIPDVDVALYVAGDVSHPALARLEIAREEQRGADLGERMGAAIERGIERCGRAIVIGSDAPTIPGWSIESAIDALERSDVVLGRAVDGGYYLVGARRFDHGIFAGVRFSTPHACADTEARVRALGLTLEHVSPFYDVDTSDDLALLRAHLAVAPHHAPSTARVLFGRP